MQISLIVAVSENGVIGYRNRLPWNVKGEQQIFKQESLNRWILVGRRTYEQIKNLKNRKFVVLSKTIKTKEKENLKIFSSLQNLLKTMPKFTDRLIVAGGEKIYKQLIEYADTIHLSTIHSKVLGDKYFPPIPKEFSPIFTKYFSSNIDYTYRVLVRNMGIDKKVELKNL